ncbi:MAG: nicotinate-nucleotide adenylyltransferase [Deltaproteobacteria bacterium]|nr:nicotinate-nucleotide adenylyltransferase [Deltaproteobacteria bacterium]
MKLGILGGTFDPVHLGHLRMALEAAEDLGLDRVDLVPAAVPPHREAKPGASFADRLAMVRMGIKGVPLLGALDLEGRRKGASYTITTLKELHREHSGDLDLYFVIGTDAFLEIRTWKDHRSLFDYAHFVLMDRPGVRSEALKAFLDSLDVPLEPLGADVYRVGNGRNRLFRRTGTFLDISSTRVRETVGRGKSIRFLVPAEVERFIMEKGLYRTHGES